MLRNRGNSFFPRSYCAYETKPTHGTLVVSRVYAADNCDQNRHPVDEDHNSIVEPASVNADIYVWAKARIEEASELAKGTPLRFGFNRTYKYKPGLLVDGIEWKEDYQEYDLLLRNPSKTATLVDVRIEFYFLGSQLVQRFLISRAARDWPLSPMVTGHSGSELTSR